MSLDIRYACIHPQKILSVLPSILANRKLFLLTRNIPGLLTWRVGLALYQAVMLSNHPSPNVVEVGSYHGLSTAYLAQASKNKGKRVKSFDWFQGLSDTHPELDQLFVKGSLLSEEQDFDKNLSDRGLRDVVDLTIGDAKTTLTPVIGGKGFSLAFLDVDLYDTTRDLLKQLKTLVRGGEIIILHDYHSPGIRRAATEFIDSFPGKLKISVIDPGALSPAVKIDIP